jgi:hypothetical protein
MEQPGLDRHEWEAEWQMLEPLVVDSPAEALPELDDLVGRLLAERGHEAREEGVDPEVLAAFRVAHEIAAQVARGEEAAPADLAHAVGLYRELYEHLLARPSRRA